MAFLMIIAPSYIDKFYEAFRMLVRKYPEEYFGHSHDLEGSEIVIFGCGLCVFVIYPPCRDEKFNFFFFKFPRF